MFSGGEEAESCENRNGAASAVLHIEESEMVEKLNRQRSKNKSKKRSESRHIQTGTVSASLRTIDRQKLNGAITYSP